MTLDHLGRLLRLELEDSPGVFLQITGQTTTSLSVTRAPVDATAADSPWKRGMSGGLGTLELAAEGVIRKGRGLSQLKQAAYAGQPFLARLLDQDGEVVRGLCFVQNFTRSAEPDGVERWVVKLEASGVPGYDFSHPAKDNPQIATPAISPSSGTFSPSNLITITDVTLGASIFFALDGAAPASSTGYQPSFFTFDGDLPDNTVMGGEPFSDTVPGYLPATISGGKILLQSAAPSLASLDTGWVFPYTYDLTFFGFITKGTASSNPADLMPRLSHIQSMESSIGSRLGVHVRNGSGFRLYDTGLSPFGAAGTYHVCLRWQSGVMSIWINGYKAHETSSVEPPPHGPDSPFLLYFASAVALTGGAGDNIGAWPEALSDDAIRALASGAVPDSLGVFPYHPAGGTRAYTGPFSLGEHPADIRIDFGSATVRSALAGTTPYTPGVVTLKYVADQSGSRVYERREFYGDGFEQGVFANWDPSSGTGVVGAYNRQTAAPETTTCWIFWPTHSGPLRGTWSGGYAASGYENGSTVPSSVTLYEDIANYGGETPTVSDFQSVAAPNASTDSWCEYLKRSSGAVESSASLLLIRASALSYGPVFDTAGTQVVGNQRNCLAGDTLGVRRPFVLTPGTYCLSWLMGSRTNYGTTCRLRAEVVGVVTGPYQFARRQDSAAMAPATALVFDVTTAGTYEIRLEAEPAQSDYVDCTNFVDHITLMQVADAVTVQAIATKSGLPDSSVVTARLLVGGERRRRVSCADYGVGTVFLVPATGTWRLRYTGSGSSKFSATTWGMAWVHSSPVMELGWRVEINGADSVAFGFSFSGSLFTSEDACIAATENVSHPLNNGDVVRLFYLDFGYADNADTSGGAEFVLEQVPTFTPALWLEADSGITTVSGAVSRWTDRSGHGLSVSQSSAGLRPTLVPGAVNRLPAVRFSAHALEHVGIGSLPSGSSPWSWFWVFRATTGAPGGWGTNDAGGGAGYRFEVGLDSTHTGLEVENAIQWGSPGFSAAYRVLSGVYPGGLISTYSQWHNGAPTTLSTVNADVVPTVPGGNVVLGDLAGAIGAAPLGGDLCEVIVIAGAVNTATRQQIEGYLAWKWGLQENLPGDHPYRSAAP